MAGRGVDGPPGFTLVVDALRPPDGQLSGLRACHDESVFAPARRAVDELLLARLGRFRHEHQTGRIDARVSAAAGLVDG